jgi:hypothetical protein
MADKAVEVSMTADEINAASQPFIDALNKAQDRFTIDQVLCASLYALGAAIRQRGGKLLLDTRLRVALPPLVAGYEDSLGMGHSRVHDDTEPH